MNRWSVKKADEKIVNEIVRKTDLGKTAATIFAARGYNSVDEIADFLQDKDLSSPFLIKDMQAAADYITNAVDEGARICIYGDYDCDGISATVMLYSYLSLLGADVFYYIPEREEGYGLNADAIREINDDGADLIITVDNGISSIEEAKLIKELGMSLVITDHHQPSEVLPDAVAVVDPHRSDCHSPYKNLCGAGVALKLIAAMEGGDYEVALEQFGEFAALATIADSVCLDGENRYIASRGLEYLKNTENCGLLALMRELRLTPDKINSTSVAFHINPKINGAGRMLSPKKAVELFLCEDDEEAEIIAKELVACVSERKQKEEKILTEIYETINNNPDVLNDRVLVFYGNDWNTGVIGLTAMQITEKFGKPSFIISVSDGMARGSARSVGGFSVFGALSYCEELFEKFGGHIGAGGFSLKEENIEAFRKKVNLYAKENYPVMPTLCIEADKYLEKEDMTIEAVKSLSVFEPFGEGNAKPLFLAVGAVVDEISLFAERHTRVKFRYKGAFFCVKYWNVTPENFPFKNGDAVDLMLYLDINGYNGREYVDYSVRDFRKSGVPQQKYINAKQCYEAYRLGEGIDAKIKTITVPCREEFVKVYKALSESGKDMDNLFADIYSDNLNYFKFRIILDCFLELSLIKTDYAKQTVYRLKTDKKVDLESADALKAIKSI